MTVTTVYTQPNNPTYCIQNVAPVEVNKYIFYIVYGMSVVYHTNVYIENKCVGQLLTTFDALLDACKLITTKKIKTN